MREGVRGYVAGYNRYLAETGVANLPDPRCRGAEWVKPITEIDAYRRFYQLALLASGTVAIDGIASSQPPAVGAPTPPLDPGGIAEGLEDALGRPADRLERRRPRLRGDRQRQGHGARATRTSPGTGPSASTSPTSRSRAKVNVSGGSLFGVPLVLIGHTDNLAWTHTVSTAYRFTPFQEIINPADPTAVPLRRPVRAT